VIFINLHKAQISTTLKSSVREDMLQEFEVRLFNSNGKPQQW
jgi:hypothetical protein